MPFFIFPYIGLLIIPIDELIFFRGVAQPPTSNCPRGNPVALPHVSLKAFVAGDGEETQDSHPMKAGDGTRRCPTYSVQLALN